MAALSLDLRIFTSSFEDLAISSRASDSTLSAVQRDSTTPAPTMDEMKQAFDQVAEDGVVQPGLLLSVLRRRNPQATEADAQSLIEMMRPNEDEDASFSGAFSCFCLCDCSNEDSLCWFDRSMIHRFRGRGGRSFIRLAYLY